MNTVDLRRQLFRRSYKINLQLVKQGAVLNICRAFDRSGEQAQTVARSRHDQWTEPGEDFEPMMNGPMHNEIQ